MTKRPKTGGRRRGTPNRVTGKIRAAIERTFENLQRDPVARLTAWAKKNPTDFYRLAARLIPQEVKNDVNFANVDVSTLTDDELALVASGRAPDFLIRRLLTSSKA